MSKAHMHIQSLQNICLSNKRLIKSRLIGYVVASMKQMFCKCLASRPVIFSTQTRIQGPLWVCPKAGVGKALIQTELMQLKLCRDREACALQACMCEGGDFIPILYRYTN